MKLQVNIAGTRLSEFQVRSLIDSYVMFNGFANSARNPLIGMAYSQAAIQFKHLASMFDIEILPLQETDEYMQQVAEECSHDNEPDHEERDHMEEMEYRSMQMGSL